MKNEKNKIPDFRVVFLMFVFFGLPIIVFLNWLTINNEVSILIKMITIIICVFLIYKASGKIYDRLIMYKGSRMKMTRILSMAMRRKEGK